MRLVIRLLDFAVYTLGNLQGELASSEADVVNALASLREARTSLAICFGESSEFVKELEDLYNSYRQKLGKHEDAKCEWTSVATSSAAANVITDETFIENGLPSGFISGKESKTATNGNQETAIGDVAIKSSEECRTNAADRPPSKRSLKKQAKLARIRSAKAAAGSVRQRTPWRDAQSNPSQTTKASSSSDTSAIAVQCTNDESIVSKRSAVRAGYYCDNFVRHFVGKVVR
eukprot:SAG31_NODE_3212_length_4544_cov_1.849719_7_plen_232_part_00